MTSKLPLIQAQPGAPLDTPELLGTSRLTQSLASFILSRYSWFIAFIVLDVLVIYAIATSDILKEAWGFIIPGIGVTIQVTLVAFVIAVALAAALLPTAMSSASSPLSDVLPKIQLFITFPLFILNCFAVCHCWSSF